jgi:glycosyltransferase involved in cell wall biosynthesis
MPRKIVFINQATGYLTIDIINEFAKEFDYVALITGSIRIQDIPIDPKVKVTYILKYNRGDNIRKAFSWLIGTVQIYFLLKFKYRNFEKFFFTIPPTAYLLALNFRSNFSIAVFDLFPDALKENGFNEKGIVYKWWSIRNKKIFAEAHRIYTLSENMKSRILQYASGIKVHVISNWSAFTGLIPVKKEKNTIIKKDRLNGKFIIQYSGNIGVTHNLETLVEVADKLRNHHDLIFLIIGRGKRSVAIGDLIDKKGLLNCKLLPFRKDEELYESLCAADLAVITLDDRMPDISVPSKAYNIMAAGLPVMAIASLTSGISKIILQHQIGKTFEKSDITGMCEFIVQLKNNRDIWNKLSANSLQASQKFTNANAAKYIEYYN